MSAAPTPSASSPEPTPPAAPAGAPDAQGMSAMDRIVADYLRARGHDAAARALGDGDAPAGTTLSADELLKKMAVFAAGEGGENAYKSSASILQELVASGTSSNIKSLIMNMGNGGAEDALALDPGDKQEGFRDLEAWVEGSLDMYRPEFRPILFPVFCHFYLDLVHGGFKDAAQKFFDTFAASVTPQHDALNWLTAIRLPHHVQSDTHAQRFRNQKYVIQMSHSGFDLLVGWLTEGVGGETAGAGDGFYGEQGKRGRAAVMRVVNNHLSFNVTSTSAAGTSWEESNGILAPLIPGGATSDPRVFNAAQGGLKLGPMPLGDELAAETEKALREAALADRDPAAQINVQHVRRAGAPGLIPPEAADLPPHPATFKTSDVAAHVARVRDQRLRISLEPSALSMVDPTSAAGMAARHRALPSICAYTLHDVPEGSPCATFSQDTSLMAAGFEESYIRLWNLKGEPLTGTRGEERSRRESTSGRGGLPTRKLIGHSGPVYSVNFDGANGSAAPPRYLLSTSADATARLWSLDTMTNVVAYRGHQNPVWDADWSPLGIYFATASRDRTARLWSTDRINALRIYAGHLSDVDCVRFHPNSLYLATGSSDNTARLWDVQRGASVRVFIGHQGAITTMAFSPDGQYLATAGEDLAINLWDLGSGKRVKKMLGHVGGVYSLAFSAESSLLVSSGADWTVRCWDVKGAGGLPEKAHANGLANGAARKERAAEPRESTDLVATFPTKRTPMTKVHFTPRNLCMVAGPYQPLGGK